MLKIVIGSKSIHKIDAVHSGLNICEIDGTQYTSIGCAASSNIDEQPLGIPQTRNGAIARACNARDLHPDADLWIGIESGIVDGGNQFYEMSVIVVLYKNGRQFSAVTSGHAIPNEFVDEARKRGFDKHTVGSVMAERTGCSSTDGTAYLSNHRVTRKDALTQGVAIAIGMWQKSTQ